MLCVSFIFLFLDAYYFSIVLWPIKFVKTRNCNNRNENTSRGKDIPFYLPDFVNPRKSDKEAYQETRK